MSETPKKQKTKRRFRLTDREKKFLAARLSGKNLSDSAREAGYCPSSPGKAAAQVMQAIEKKAPDLLARNGLDDDSFIKKYLLPRLNSVEIGRAFHPGDRKFYYSKPLPNESVRMTATALVAKMKGLIKEEQPQSAGPVIKSVIINGAYRPPIQLPQTNGHEPKQLEVAPPPRLSPGGLGDPGGNRNGQL